MAATAVLTASSFKTPMGVERLSKGIAPKFLYSDLVNTIATGQGFRRPSRESEAEQRAKSEYVIGEAGYPSLQNIPRFPRFDWKRYHDNVHGSFTPVKKD